MNRSLIKLFVFLSITFLSNILSAQDIKAALLDAEKQLSGFYNNVVSARDDMKIFPRSLRNDSIKLVVPNDWTSGFCPGMLWYMYQYTGRKEWKAKAIPHYSSKRSPIRSCNNSLSNIALSLISLLSILLTEIIGDNLG